MIWSVILVIFGDANNFYPSLIALSPYSLISSYANSLRYSSARRDSVRRGRTLYPGQRMACWLRVIKDSGHAMR